MGYHLVDEVEGMARSRRLIKSFEYFGDAKAWINSNIDELYGFIPEYDSRKAPDLSKGNSLVDLNRNLSINSYNGWKLTLIKAKETNGNYRGRKPVRLVNNKVWYEIYPLVNMGRRASVTNNGVRWNGLKSLTKEEQTIVANASLSRVLKSTKLALLIEWTGNKGTTVTWIPKSQLVI